MNIDRLKKIIAYSKTHRDIIDSDVRSFCAHAGIERDNDLLNVLQIARKIFFEKGYLVFEIPFADDEIGAICFRGDWLGYVVLNTSLPVANSNFALAHEIYHVMSQKNATSSKVEFAADDYYEHEEEYAANLFAGMLLMPETGFVRMFHLFEAESDKDMEDVFIRLMSYYKVPYMAVLIRSLELELCSWKSISKVLAVASKEQIRNRMTTLWLDESVLNPSYKDDSKRIELMLREYGEEYAGSGYINERIMDKAITNFLTLSKKIKGER